ncbi:hypothetical protein T4D_7418 [Trichinella pseudospiralis]|uniref:Secreted protein n=1 Tax=Trichinella pseudospiralis TaxID=6337 RepID=A0A0V1EIU0_TRIPS|nr:hypothetical protein T4D_7418 [Trichinella pseudospiralis]
MRVRLIIVTIMSLFKAWRARCSACYFEICFEKAFNKLLSCCNRLFDKQIGIYHSAEFRSLTSLHV